MGVLTELAFVRPRSACHSDVREAEEARHAIGTVRAMEMGETEGAMSSLAMTVSGMVTVLIASIAGVFL